MEYSDGTTERDSAVPPWLEQVLETVAEFRQASIELVAWELSLPVSTLRGAWAHAVAHGLLRELGADPDTGETMYRLSLPADPRGAVEPDTGDRAPSRPEPACD